MTKKINYNDHNIQIVTEKKKLFSKEIKRKVTTISINEIKMIRKELYQGQWNSMTIETKKGQEEFIVSEELEGNQELESVYNFLITKKEEKQFEVRILEIETMEEISV